MATRNTASRQSSPNSSADRRKAQPTRLSAALLSLLLPGLGQAARGHVRRGIVLYFIDFVSGMVALAMLLYLPIEHWNAAVALTVFAGARIAIIADAGLRRAIAPATNGRGGLTAWPALMFIGFIVTSAYAWAIRAAWCESFVIPTGSMAPAVQPGDRIIADKLCYHFTDIGRGDVVVFRPDTEPVMYLGRVIGLPGDTIEVRDQVVFINGEQIAEPYVHLDDEIMFNDDFNAVTLGNGEYFMMGDRRRWAVDSRVHGPVRADQVVARARSIFWSSAPQQSVMDRNSLSPPPLDTTSGTRWHRIGLRL